MDNGSDSHTSGSVSDIRVSWCQDTLPGEPPYLLQFLQIITVPEVLPGWDDRIVIFDNGVAVISQKTASKEITLNQTDLERIAGIFTEAQFSMLQGNYTARRGADYFRYTISYHGKTVIAEDSAIPPSLQPVIDEMNRIISRANSGERIVRPFAIMPL